MKFGRPDYEDLDALNQRVPKEEPVFLLRGQDMLVPTLLELYADMLLLIFSGRGDYPCILELVSSVREQSVAMLRWQRAVSKFPDMPCETSRSPGE